VHNKYKILAIYWQYTDIYTVLRGLYNLWQSSSPNGIVGEVDSILIACFIRGG